MGIDISKLITSDALIEQSQGIWEGLNRQSCYTDKIIQHMREAEHETGHQACLPACACLPVTGAGHDCLACPCHRQARPTS